LGHGPFRISGNFAPLEPTIRDAKNNGYDDVLWLLDDYIKEMSFINVFSFIKSRFGIYELITPPLDGCIFNGTVRRSIIDLNDEIFDETKVKVVQKNVQVGELISAKHEGRLLEFFGGSTQSNIQSISKILYKDESLDFNQEYKFANYLNEKLTKIMSGPTTHEWITKF
jgi:branched-chain amino acid aminotransferase